MSGLRRGREGSIVIVVIIVVIISYISYIKLYYIIIVIWCYSYVSCYLLLWNYVAANPVFLVTIPSGIIAFYTIFDALPLKMKPQNRF